MPEWPSSKGLRLRRHRRATAAAHGARTIAMHGFSAAARKLAPRDRFIGWTPERRERNLPLVIDNPRFLILPWMPSQHPTSIQH